MDHNPKSTSEEREKPMVEEEVPHAKPRGEVMPKKQTLKYKAIASQAVGDSRQHVQGALTEEKDEHDSSNGPEPIYPDYTAILPRFHYSSVTQNKQVVQVQGTLCQDCAQIDIDTLLKRPHKTIAGQTVKKELGPAQTLKAKSCPLCHLVYSSLGPHYQKYSGLIPLRTFSSTRMRDKTWSSIDTNLMQAHFTCKYIVSQPEGRNGPIRIIREHIQDYDLFKNWINLCQTYHTKVCGVKSSELVPLQRLIDCETRTIIPASNHPYVALSYVWGLGDEIHRFSETLPLNLPNTIEDTISVTLKLGYRYLWIDRYCINQQSAEDKDAQFPVMDVIYQNAEVTIIAAAGGDPSYGLPGVGIRKRGEHAKTMCSKVGKHFLITTEGVYPPLSVSSSKWKTRAWTYQEAILSRRRLVFAQEGVYFECYGMHCSESHNFPLLDMHREDMQGFRHTFCQEQQVGMFPRGAGTSKLAILHRIGEYSKLELTRPEDILKGISGILNNFQRRPHGPRHYAGIPILPRGPRKTESEVPEWTPSMGFLLSLLWNLKRPSERRTGRDGTEFPSWSWTGWYGSVEWKEAVNWLPSFKFDPDVRLNVELKDGRALNLEEYQNLDSEDSRQAQSQPSTFIRISTWTLK
ncbi:heterokaryon incompatibility protein-domain-containing protein [Cadophora sp. MPI-SDFR-AT-0126]|nr:heterokaryon incompatibility protein-domain-containing protein [Leotiomycetes sp. MPI-SDFR-AT-0126]